MNSGWALWPEQGLPRLDGGRRQQRLADSFLDDIHAQEVDEKLYKLLTKKKSRNLEQKPALTEKMARANLAMQFIATNRQRYAGRWIALSGDTLLAEAATAREVYAAIAGAREPVPLVVKVEPVDEPPFGGW